MAAMTLKKLKEKYLNMANGNTDETNSITEDLQEENERLVYGWRKIMENITRGYGHHE